MKSTARLLTCLLAILVSLALVSCGPSPGGGSGKQGSSGNSSKSKVPEFEKGSTMDIIQKRGKLIVGTPYGFPPFADKNPNTGAIEGFDIEIAKQIAIAIFGNQIENRVQFVEIDPRDREIKLEAKNIDIALGRYEISVARKKFIDFAGPYYTSFQGVTVRAGSSISDSDIPASLLDLSERKVCVIQGSGNVPALQSQAPGVDVSTVRNTVQECGVLLKNNAVSAVLGDYVDIQPILADRNFQLLSTFHPIPYGIGVHKGTSDFRQFLNDLLDNEIRQVWNSLYSSTVGQTGAQADNQPVPDRY